MEHKVTHVVDATYRDDQAELDTRITALAADALVSARAIRQPIASPDDILTAFDRITYDKGNSVLAMFERYLGAATFQRGVRDYLASRTWGNATSKDFAAAMAKASGNAQVEAAFASFLDQAGAPQITAKLACANNQVSVELAQQRYVRVGSPEPPPTTPWLVPVCVVYDKGAARGEQCLLLTGATGALPLDTRTCPRWVMPNAAGAGYYRSTYTLAQVAALRDEAWNKLDWRERRALFDDLREAFGNGRMPLHVVLSFVPRLLAGGDRFTTVPALDSVIGLDRLVPAQLRHKYEYWLRATFGPSAQAAGLAPKDTDTLDTERTREGLIGAIGWTAREPALVGEAVRLAEHWRDLSPSIRGLVIKLAADARGDVFDRLVRDVASEPDRRRRDEVYRALGAVRDVARQKRALALVLDKRHDIRETIEIVLATTTDANLVVAQQFFRDNLDAIIARMPKDETTSPLAGMAAGLFTATCRADSRDAIVDYVTKTFAPMPAGERSVKQAIEAMDQCIAIRAKLEPEVRAWLGGLRLPKPKP
jgi:alanyl aminopeptidase